MRSTTSLYLKFALQNGVTRQELIKAITHLAFYASWPTASTAIGLAQHVSRIWMSETKVRKRMRQRNRQAAEKEMLVCYRSAAGLSQSARLSQPRANSGARDISSPPIRSWSDTSPDNGESGEGQITL
jgi:hypothetical protein